MAAAWVVVGATHCEVVVVVGATYCEVVVVWALADEEEAGERKKGQDEKVEQSELRLSTHPPRSRWTTASQPTTTTRP